MFSEDRYNEIRNQIKINGRIDVKTMAKFLNVSVDTIRRDFKILEERGELERVHGGAKKVEKPENQIVTNASFRKRLNMHLEDKKEISVKALKHVKEYESIALNAGTTNIEFAKLLIENFEVLTVFTNSLLIANILDKKPTFTVILFGGFLNHEEHSFYSNSMLEFNEKFNCDKTFININAISLERGLSDFRQGEKEVINSFIKSSNEVFVLADSSKFETTSYINITPLESVNKIITDSKVKNDIIKKYLKKGITIL